MATIMGTFGGGCLAWLVAHYFLKPTNAWWTTEDRNILITKSGAAIGGLMGAIITSHSHATTRKIVGTTTFLDAIKNDNAEQMARWLKEDAVLQRTGLRLKTILKWKDSYGRTPLMLAVIHGSTHVAKLLIAHTKKPYFIDIGEIDSADATGRTALHWAAATQQFEIAELLVKQGAHKTIADKQGHTPFNLVNNNDERFKDLLRTAVEIIIIEETPKTDAQKTPTATSTLQATTPPIQAHRPSTHEAIANIPGDLATILAPVDVPKTTHSPARASVVVAAILVGIGLSWLMS